jgi:AsmA protein
VISGLKLPSARQIRIGALALLAAVLVIGCAFFAFMATRDLDAVARDLVAGLQAESGGALVVGRTHTRVWPTPRVVLDDVSFRRADGSVSGTATRATITINPLDLIDGRLDSPNVSLEGAVIRLAAGPIEHFYDSPRAVAGAADALSGLFDGQKRLTNLRLVVQRGRFILSSRQAGGDLTFDPVDLRLKYAGRSGRVDLFARRISEIRPIELSVQLPTRASLMARDRAPAELQISGFGSRLKFSGTISRRPDLALNGRLEASIQDALERALGLSTGERRSRDDALTNVSANLTLDPRGGGLDALVIRRGEGQLTGIASLRENNGRWSISSTLAGDLVDGTAAHNAINRLKTAEGAWSPREVDVNPAPGLDLDLRLSTRAFRLGPLTLENAALSVFTRAGRAEYAIAESSIGPGSLKARLSIIDRERSQDIRLSFSGEKLDSETILDRALGLGRVRGPMNFAFQLESHGNSIEALVAGLTGSGTVEVRNGEILGIDLNRLMARSADMRTEAALLSSLGGRSPFEQLSVNLAFRNGRIEPVGSVFTNGRMDGSLEGLIDLTTQRNQLSAVLRRRQALPNQPSDFFAFRIEGPLFQPVLKPDASLLQRRSLGPSQRLASPG